MKTRKVVTAVSLVSAFSMGILAGSMLSTPMAKADGDRQCVSEIIDTYGAGSPDRALGQLHSSMATSYVGCLIRTY